MSDADVPKTLLDLRETKCPLNFVKTKLALEKLSKGELLEVWVAQEGESSINIPNSIRQEGHMVLEAVKVESPSGDRGYLKIRIKRA